MVILLTSLLLLASDPAPLFDRVEQADPPFMQGEELTYAVYWKPPAWLKWLIGDLEAGQLKVGIEEARFEEREVWRITATAVSTGIVRRRILEVDDKFVSHMDRGDFRSYRFEKIIREGEKTQKDVISDFDYREDEVRVKKVDLRKDPPKTEVETFTGIPGPLADVLSVFYVARVRPLSVGSRYLIHLADDSEPKRVDVQVEERETIRAGVKKYEAIRISTVGGFFKNAGGFLIWYSTDPARLPLKFQADAKIGKVYGELTKVERPQYIRKTIKQPAPN